MDTTLKARLISLFGCAALDTGCGGFLFFVLLVAIDRPTRLFMRLVLDVLAWDAVLLLLNQEASEMEWTEKESDWNGMEQAECQRNQRGMRRV